MPSCHDGSTYPDLTVALLKPAWTQDRSCYSLAKFNRGYFYPASNTHPAYNFYVVEPALPQSALATAEAQAPYELRTLPSMLRVLEPNALHTPELSPFANTAGLGLSVDLPQKDVSLSPVLHTCHGDVLATIYLNRECQPPASYFP